MKHCCIIFFLIFTQFQWHLRFFFSSMCPASCALDECGAKSESIFSKRRDHIAFSPNAYVNFTWCFFITYCVILSSVLLDKAWRHHHHVFLWTLGWTCKAKAAAAGVVWPSCFPEKETAKAVLQGFYTLIK